VNVTLSLDPELVRKIRSFAVERDTTLTGLIRQNLEHLANEDAVSGRRPRQRRALEESFEKFSFRVGKPNLEESGSVCPILTFWTPIFSCTPMTRVTGNFAATVLHKMGGRLPDLVGRSQRGSGLFRRNRRKSVLVRA
jgi:hypothetical protein